MFKDKKFTITPKILILICAGVIILIVSSVAFGANYKRWFGNKTVTPTQTYGTKNPNLTIDPNASDYITPEATGNPQSEGIAIPGWGQISIPAGKKEVMVEFPNPESNTGKYYLTFQLVLKDTNEVLYTSGLVPPGKVIRKITLNRALEKGTYDAIIRVQPYKMNEEKTMTNNADMEIALIVI